MDPVTAAAAISAGTQLVGGLFGSSSSKNESRNNRKEARRQFNIQDDYNKNRLQYTVKDAIKAGVNPVVAIGSGSGHYSPTISAGGDSGAGNMIADSISNAGRSISDMILARQARQDRAIALESANLDLEGKRLQNDILRQRLLTDRQPGIPSVGQTNSIGHTDSIQDLYIPFRLPNGEIVYRINQEGVPDTDITNISTWQTLGDDPGSVSRWFREVILPSKGSWNDRYLPGYAWGRKFLTGLRGK